MNLLGYIPNKPIISYDRFNDVTSISIVENDFVGLKSWYFKSQVGHKLFSHLQKSFYQSQEKGLANFQISKNLPQDLLYSDQYLGYRRVKFDQIFEEFFSLKIDELEITSSVDNPKQFFKFVMDQVVGKQKSHPQILETSISSNILQDSAKSEFFFNQLRSYKEQRNFSANNHNTEILNRSKDYFLKKLQHEKLKNNIVGFNRREKSSEQRVKNNIVDFKHHSKPKNNSSKEKPTITVIR